MRLLLTDISDTLITWGPVLAWVLIAIAITVIVALVIRRQRESRRRGA